MKRQIVCGVSVFRFLEVYSQVDVLVVNTSTKGSTNTFEEVTKNEIYARKTHCFEAFQQHRYKKYGCDKDSFKL